MHNDYDNESMMDEQARGRTQRFVGEETAVLVDGKTQVLNLDYKTAAILCYLPIALVNLVASLVVINSEPKQNKFVRFHAMQSLVMIVCMMVLCLANFTVGLILGAIPIVNMLLIPLNLVISLIGLVFIWQCVVGMIAASKGEMKHIPYIGQIAEERLAEQ